MSSKRKRRAFAMESLEERKCLAASVTGIDLNSVDPFQVTAGLTGAGPNVFFFGQTIATPLSLWRTDGTPTGTIPLVQVSSLAPLANHNGQLYFVGNSASSGEELWRSDGTVAGTVLVKDITPGTASSQISNFTSHAGVLYFVNQGELFRSDGTAAGTSKAVDLLAGQSDNVSNLVSTANGLYFTSGATANTQNLYKTDGTPAGASPVSTVPSGSLANLTDVSGQLYFTRGSELWRVDQTTGQSSSEVIPAGELTNVNGELFFASSARLVKTNPVSGTEVLAELYGVGNLTNFQGTLYFAGNGDNGNELWRSDGTVSGTFQVKDINDFTADYYPIGSSNPGSFTTWNGRLIFRVDSGLDYINGLWTTDGTAAGTTQLERGFIDKFAASGSVLTFGPAIEYTSRLFARTSTTGTATELLSNGSGALSSNPSPVELNGQVYVAADNGLLGRELFRLNADNSLTLVADLLPGASSSNVGNLVKANGLLYFTAKSPTQPGGSSGSLYRSDGTPEGTVELQRFLKSNDVSVFENGNQTYFVANVGINGRELFKTDGNVSGTTIVKDIDPRFFDSHSGYAGESSSPENLVVLNGLLYFTAKLNGEREIWKSDGTEAGTVKAVGTAGTLNISDVQALSVYNGRLIFGGKVGTSWRLFSSNGTASGTTTVATGFQSISQSIVANGTLYFVGTKSDSGQELWKMPPVGAPVLVKNINPTGSSSPNQLTSANGKLYFVANDGTHGTELWQSDGTAAGTVQVRDTLPGSLSSNPVILGNLNGVLFYAANDDGTTGRELWQTNGSVSGARLAKDIFPGSGSSNPTSFAIAGQQIYFSATQRAIGTELAKLRAAIPSMTLPTVAAQSFTSNGPVRLAPQGLIADPDTTVFWGATLSVTLGNTYHTGDRLQLATTSTVSVVGSRVFVNGVAVGVQVSGAAGRDLSILFTQAATQPIVREVMRAIAFNNTARSPYVGTRIVRFDLTDGEGGLANSRAVRINVTAAAE